MSLLGYLSEDDVSGHSKCTHNENFCRSTVIVEGLDQLGTLLPFVRGVLRSHQADVATLLNEVSQDLSTVPNSNRNSPKTELTVYHFRKHRQSAIKIRFSVWECMRNETLKPLLITSGLYRLCMHPENMRNRRCALSFPVEYDKYDFETFFLSFEYEKLN